MGHRFKPFEHSKVMRGAHQRVPASLIALSWPRGGPVLAQARQDSMMVDGPLPCPAPPNGRAGSAHRAQAHWGPLCVAVARERKNQANMKPSGHRGKEQQRLGRTRLGGCAHGRDRRSC